MSLPTGSVTFLFTDIVGSTQLWEQHSAHMHAALSRHDALLRAAVDAHGGDVFNTAGDAFHVVFADAGAALATAVEAQRAVAAEDWGPLGPLRVRMALHTGRPWHRGGTYYGPPLNRAARLVSAAHGGQIILSRAAADAAAGRLPADVALVDLGLHRLRDLTEPEQIFQVRHPALQADFPRLRSLDALPNNLPIQLSTFVGRHRELAVVRDLTRDHRLVTLTGTGGSGKTRLALQAAADVARHYADGAWLVELAPVAGPEGVAAATAAALGLSETARPRPRQHGTGLGPNPASDVPSTRADWTHRLVDHLRAKEALIVLDNCEHVVAAAADLASALLTTCPGIHILATSREPLGVSGERVSAVPPLELPDADSVDVEALIGAESVRLFAQRALLARPDFQLTPANATAVAQIVRRLDGIPLAIELAAARLKLLSPEQIAARLDDRFRLLTGGSRNALPRQRTLEAAMDWSYELLDEAEQTLFRRLSVFGGGFTLDAVEAICGGATVGPATHGAADPARDGLPRVAGNVLDALTQLVDKSLVVHEPGNAEVRYRMLETVRQYARVRLAASGEAGSLVRRHRDWCLALAEAAGNGLDGRAQVASLDRLAVEHDNLTVALDGAFGGASAGDDPVAGVRLVGALWRYWFIRGHLSEGRAWHDRALAVRGTSDALRARVLLGAGALAWRERDYAAAERCLTQSVALHRDLGDVSGLARAQYHLGYVAHYRGDHDRAAALYAEALEHARSAEDTWAVAAALDAQGLLAWQQGDYGRAATLLSESLSHARSIGDLRGMAGALNILGRVAYDTGDYAQAAEMIGESLDVYRALGDRVAIAYAHHKLGNVALSQGDLERAERLFEEAHAQSRALGERRGIAYAANSLGNVHRLRGDTVGAEQVFKSSLVLSTEIADKRGIADATANLGWMAGDRGDADEAIAHLHHALGLYVAMGDKLGVAETLAGLAHALAARDPRAAATMLGAGVALRDAIGAPLPPIYAAAHAADIATLRLALGDTAFEAAMVAGRSVDIAKLAAGGATVTAVADATLAAGRRNAVSLVATA